MEGHLIKASNYLARDSVLANVELGFLKLLANKLVLETFFLFFIRFLSKFWLLF